MIDKAYIPFVWINGYPWVAGSIAFGLSDCVYPRLFCSGLDEVHLAREMTGDRLLFENELHGQFELDWPGSTTQIYTEWS